MRKGYFVVLVAFCAYVGACGMLRKEDSIPANVGGPYSGMPVVCEINSIDMEQEFVQDEVKVFVRKTITLQGIQVRELGFSAESVILQASGRTIEGELYEGKSGQILAVAFLAKEVIKGPVPLSELRLVQLTDDPQQTRFYKCNIKTP